MSNKIGKAGTVILRNNNGQTEILLGHRSRGFDDWTFPKGKVEPGETPNETALRETKEETGFDVRLIKKLPDIVYEYHSLDKINVRQYMFLAEIISGEFKISYENDFFEWVDYEKALKFLQYKSLIDFLISIKNELKIKETTHGKN